ncbi:MAG TPA: peptidyl-prolyl cis-trans isomerase, partial [Acidobacteriota bacterium]|nr:peptidyl-prolyl cis-trans isomerase [Acidobacteriota bacterium]
VKKYSDDKRASKPKCGNLPPFKDGELADDLKREVDKIKPGQFTSILKMPNAFQILKLESRVESKAKPFEDVANEISSRLAYEKSKTKIKEYFKSLREKAYIKVADGYEDNFDLEDEPIAGETEGGQ